MFPVPVIIDGYWCLGFPMVINGRLRIVPYMGLKVRCFWWPPYDPNKLLPPSKKVS